MEIVHTLEKMAEEICDNYCKYPEQYEENDDNLFYEHCEECHLNNL